MLKRGGARPSRRAMPSPRAASADLACAPVVAAKQATNREQKQLLADRTHEYLLEAAEEAAIIRARVAESMSLDARLDKAEAKVDAEERADASAMKQVRRGCTWR